MKKGVIIMTVLVLVFLVGIACALNLGSGLPMGVVATVNGEVITTEQLANRIELNEFNNAVNEAYVQKTFQESQKEEQLSKSLLPVKKRDVLRELIKEKVVFDQLELLSQSVSFEDVKTSLHMAFQEMKSDTSLATYYACLDENLKRVGMTEDRYLSLWYDYEYSVYATTKLQQIARDVVYDQKSDKPWDEQFGEYVDSLVKQATIRESKRF